MWEHEFNRNPSTGDESALQPEIGPELYLSPIVFKR